MPITYGGAGAVANNDTAATALNVPYPSGIVAGDVLVLNVGVASATVATLPSGWIAGGVSSSSGGNSPSERIMVKIATGSETGSLAVTTASATSRGIMLRFSGVDNTTPIDGTGSTTASATATASHVLPSITTTVSGCALVAMAVAQTPGGTWTTPTTQGGTWTELAETTGVAPSTTVQINIWSGSGATGTVTMTRSSSVRGCAGMLALRPAAAAGTVYQVSGTVAGTSTTSGTATARYAVAGAVAGTSTVSGSVFARYAATGTVAATSGISGSVTRVPRVYSVSGTVAAVSAVSGSVTVMGAAPRVLSAVALPPRFAVRALSDRYSARPPDDRFTIRTMAPRYSAATKTRYDVRSL